MAGEGELGDELVGVEDGDLAVLSDEGDLGAGVAAADAEEVNRPGFIGGLVV